MKIRLIGFVALTTLAFTACNRSHEFASPKHFRLALRDDAKSLDPAVAYDTVSFEVLGNLVEALSNIIERYEIEPLLAESFRS